MTHEVISHYVCKFSSAQLVVVGDSIGAGGRNWAGWFGLPPFSTRNLAGDGYTIHQVSGQISKALAYRTKTLLVFGGTNDAFAIQSGRLSINEIKEDVQQIIESCNGVNCIFVLPPPSKYPEINKILDQVRDAIKDVVLQNDVVLIDVSQLLADPAGKIEDQYTSDGVHLTSKGYDVIAEQIKTALQK